MAEQAEKRYVIAKGRSIIFDRQYLQGTVFKLSRLKELQQTEASIARLCEKGALIELSAEEMAKSLGGGGSEAGAPAGPAAGGGPGPWNVNPASLKDKKLEELNAMILGKDKTVKPFETVEEAVAFLSQHFKG